MWRLGTPHLRNALLVLLTPLFTPHALFANIYLGAALLGTQLPDEKFLRMLEAALVQPIFYTQEELEARYQSLPPLGRDGSLN